MRVGQIILNLRVINRCTKRVKGLLFAAGVLLDGLARAAGVRGGLPADAVGDDPSGGRRAPAHRQHVHLAALHPALLVATRAQAQAAARYQN